MRLSWQAVLIHLILQPDCDIVNMRNYNHGINLEITEVRSWLFLSVKCAETDLTSHRE